VAPAPEGLPPDFGMERALGLLSSRWPARWFSVGCPVRLHVCCSPWAAA